LILSFWFSNFISVFTCIGGQNVCVAPQTEKYFKKIKTLNVGVCREQEITETTKSLSYRFGSFEFYFCLHLYRWTKRVRCPRSGKIFQKNLRLGRNGFSRKRMQRAQSRGKIIDGKITKGSARQRRGAEADRVRLRVRVELRGGGGYPLQIATSQQAG
jgi:hypothetical protein